nr:hypothetical protein [uncultured Blautia sp.]
MRKNIKGLGLLLAIACISGVFYQGTGAYLTDERKVVNHLDFAGTQGMQAVLTEPSWEPDKGLLVLPGTRLLKDPQVTNTSALDMDELVALKVEFVYAGDSGERKKGERLTEEDMKLVSRVFDIDYNADDAKKSDWIRFKGESGEDVRQCFYYKKVLKRQLPEKGETTIPLFTQVKVRKEVNNLMAERIRQMGGVEIRVSGRVLQQMEGEKSFGLNSPKEAYQAGLFQELEL